MTASAGPPLHAVTENGVLELTLCRPPVNALSLELVGALEDAVAAVTPAVRAATIVSEVPKVFMAGADLGLLGSGDAEALHEYVGRLQTLFTAIERLPLPVVAGLDGACLGGGLELALCCDIRIVSGAARLGLPEVGLGILPGAGGTQRLVRAIGQGAARDLLLTGRRIGGEEAVRWGLASRLAGDGGAATAARELAAELASGARPAQRAIKELALDASDARLEDGLRSELSRWNDVYATADAREGIDAFLNKRAARFG